PVGAVTDLAACPLHVEPIEAALGTLRSFVTRATLVPYDVATRRGELKHLLVTANPRGELMVRFVLRSREAETRIRKHLPDLLAELPGLRVVSLNLLPEHAALTEGAQEIVLVGDTLTMPVDDLDLHLRPRSFFQTNTGVAAALYRRAAAWVGELAPRSLWDLYCGVGGFALSAARAVPGLDVLGVEISDEAIASARRSAADLGLDNARFEVGDATTVDGSGTRRGGVGRDEADTTGGAAGRTTSGAPAGDADSSGPDVAPTPDVVVVNPPRRGIGPDLAAWLERGRAEAVLYSSCNPTTLARDLAAMPSLRLERAQLLDMFPNTPHSEVLTLLRRV
ncbi:MAG: methyltransferase domain-containing protein, partial [Salana multivorans]|nr:methyltransferase domain-containing protein [Salana multivorans]